MRRGGDKYVKAVEAARITNLTISDFLTESRKDTFPKKWFNGVGQRWKETELMEWRNENAKRD